MRYAEWMERDERTEAERRRDRIRSLRHEETQLQARLEKIDDELFELGARGRC